MSRFEMPGGREISGVGQCIAVLLCTRHGCKGVTVLHLDISIVVVAKATISEDIANW